MTKIKNISGRPNIAKPKMKRITIDPNEVKILIYCDYACSTGFGYVASHFVNEIKKNKNFKIVIHAINDFTKAPYDIGDNIVVMPTHLNPKGDPYGRIQFLNSLYQVDFDLLFMLNDVEIISQLMGHINKVKREKKKEKRKIFKIITYSPIDSPVRKFDLKGFQYIDAPITYTKYGRKIMEDVEPKLKGRVEILPHGCDTEVFYKLGVKKILKTKIKMFGLQNQDAFVFGSVNRNQVRKDMGAILIAFANFRKNNPDKKVLLYLHCNPNDTFGINIERACERVDLIVDKDVFLPDSFNENKGLSLSELNAVYNVMDVFVNTTTAEGWGLTNFEAMATETPVITPIHTSLYEVTNKGKLVEALKISQEMIFVNDFEKIRYISNPDEVVEKMEMLYSALTRPQTEQWQEIQDRNKKALRFVKKFKWEEISQNFKSILNNLVKK